MQRLIKVKTINFDLKFLMNKYQNEQKVSNQTKLIIFKINNIILVTQQGVTFESYSFAIEQEKMILLLKYVI